MLGITFIWCSVGPTKQSFSVPASLKLFCFQVNSNMFGNILLNSACSVSHHLEIGLLNLASGRSSPEHQPALQVIQNAITPSSLISHWLHVATCIRFKNTSACLQSQKQTSTSLKTVIKPCSAVHSLQASRSTRSTIPRQGKRKIWIKTSRKCVPGWWNKLPLDIRTAVTGRLKSKSQGQPLY